MQQQIGKRIRQQWREQRDLPAIPVWLKEQADEKCIWIFSVGPWQLTRNLGSWGYATVPACPEGKPYVRISSPVPAIFHEPKIVDEKHFQQEPIDGMFVAEQILGIGKNMSKQDSWIPFGCFIGSQRGPNAEPTGEELEAANKALTEQLWWYFNEANNTPEHLRNSVIDSEHHRYAARRLKRTEVPWMAQDSPVQRRDCPNCGTVSNIGIVSCPACKFILNVERYDEWVLEGRVSDPIRLAHLKGITHPEPDVPSRPTKK